jgi:hypothetical protein
MKFYIHIKTYKNLYHIYKMWIIDIAIAVAPVIGYYSQL